MTNINFLGEYLKKHIEANKLSERLLAKRCSMSHSYLNQIIKGCNPTTGHQISPTMKTLEKLSIGLNIDVDLLQKITRGVKAEDKNAKSMLIKNFEESATNDGIIVGSNGDRVIPWDTWNDIKNALKLIEGLDFDPSDSSNEDWTSILKDFQLVLNLHKNR